MKIVQILTIIVFCLQSVHRDTIFRIVQAQEKTESEQIESIASEKDSEFETIDSEEINTVSELNEEDNTESENEIKLTGEDNTVDSIDSYSTTKSELSANKLTEDSSEMIDQYSTGESIVRGMWGSVQWNYNAFDGSLVFESGGQLGTADQSPWNADNGFNTSDVTSIKFTEQVFAPTNSSYLLAGRNDEGSHLSNCREIVNLQFLITNNVNNMSGLFYGIGVTSLDLSNFDTSTVTNMNRMFDSSSVEELNLHSFNTSNVTDMAFMFWGIPAKSLDLSHFDTSKVTTMVRMFRMSKIEHLNLSSFNTIGVNMDLMFDECVYLKELTLGQSFRFAANSALPVVRATEGYTGGWSLIGSGQNGDSKISFNTSNTFMTEYDGSHPGTYTWDRDTVTGVWGTVPWTYDRFKETIFLHGGQGGTANTAPWKTYTSVKEIIVEESVGLPADSRALFFRLRALESIKHGDNLDVSNVENMSLMFSETVISELDVSRWDTSKVNNMAAMFFSATGLQELDVSNWDTSNVSDMQSMFLSATGLQELDVSNWDTSNVSDMQGMFFSATGLQELDVSNWDTSRVGSSGFSIMFSMMNLKKLTLGEKSIFNSSVDLPAITPNDDFTGRWFLQGSGQNEEDRITFASSDAFMSEYDGSHPGTYVWERVAPEQLVAEIDRVSDQSQSITGYGTESTDELTITYQNSEGNTVILTKDDPRIIWGDYQDENQQVRHFRIDLIGNERLETKSKVTITMSNSSNDKTEEQLVIQGIDYRVNNLTLDRFKINELSTQEELEALILQESRAQATNVLTEADMTEDFRIVDTDLTHQVDEDGTYYAILEVGNKAYQVMVGIDVTSNLDHMRVTIPTKMIFKSLYNPGESNREFESQAYELRNQSTLAVDTFINQLVIDDSAGIVLLEPEEDPLDYAESDNKKDNHTYDDISTPLLRLNLNTDETKIQLYEAMEEQPLIQLKERSRSTISLTGYFYGDYPRWVDNVESGQGGYYEDLLVPNYRIVLRFVPR